MILTIENDGAMIRATNYWSSEYARCGAVYISINAGAIRVLLPDALIARVISEMRPARHVIVSRGPWPAAGRHDAIELLWDDNTAQPFSLHLGTEQIDRLPPDTDSGRTDLRCTTWTRWPDGTPRPIYGWPARYRRVRQIPDLAPWRHVSGIEAS